MDPDAVLDPRNEGMETVWKAALPKTFKKKNLRGRERAQICSVKPAEICDDVQQVLARPGRRLDSTTFYRASMVASGTKRILDQQADLLLEDTKKLLDTMRRERRKKFYDGPLEDFVEEEGLGVSSRAPRSRTPGPIKMLDEDWDSKEVVIDWKSGPPRARLQDITLPDENVDFSPAYMAEMAERQANEASLEGPTLLDWEVFKETLPEFGDKETAGGMTEIPSDTLEPMEPAPDHLAVPEPTAHLAVPEPEVRPAVSEPRASPLPEAPTGLQPPEEEASQIELSSVEETKGRKPLKKSKARIVVDPVTELGSSMISKQIREYEDTMRKPTARKDAANENVPKKVDITSRKPLRLKVLADVLLHLFRRCDDPAPYPLPSSPPHLHMAKERADGSYIRDVSGAPVQDVSTGRTSGLEGPTGWEQDASALQTIEEQEAIVPAPLPSPAQPPVTAAEDVPPSAPKETGTRKKKRVQEKSDKKDETQIASPLTRDSRSSQEPASSTSSEPKLPEFRRMEQLILKELDQNPKFFFHDIMSAEATDREAAHLFGLLLQMYQNGEVDLQQDYWCGPITIQRCPPNQ